MRFIETFIPGAFVIELERREDERGWFARSFCEREFAAAGLCTRYPQSNLSFNEHELTLRGMHYQAAPFQEVKIVRALQGTIYDVIIDLRQASPTWGKWIGAELSAENGRALYVPAGFAHGFLSLTSHCTVHYQMGEFYEPAAARGLRWNDPRFEIHWPKQPKVIATQDANRADFDAATFDG